MAGSVFEGDPMRISTKAKEIVDRISAATNADVAFYNAPIARGQDLEVISRCHNRRCKPNLLALVITEGGDADAAYRIARCLQDRYEKFTCYISGYCKSAGTLLALGANELVFSEHGELGPLDIQMAKKDDLWESESGLTVMTALTAIHEKALVAFEHFFVTITAKSGGRITGVTGSEIAAKITDGLYGPITEQIDPIHLGEAFRAMAIAKEYGQRLMRKSRNFTSSGLERLISEYPSHGFVIDQHEATTIFRRVRAATADEHALMVALEDAAQLPSDRPLIDYLSDELTEPQDADTTPPQQETIQQFQTDGNAPTPRGNATPDGQPAVNLAVNGR
jgi:hypothetical protein